MPSTDLTLTATDKASGVVDETNARVQAALKKTADVIRATAAQEATDLQLVLGQFGLIASATTEAGAAQQAGAEVVSAAAEQMVAAAAAVLESQVSVAAGAAATTEAVAASSDAEVAAREIAAAGSETAAAVIAEANLAVQTSSGERSAAVVAGAAEEAAARAASVASAEPVIASNAALDASFARARQRVQEFGKAAEEGQIRVVRPAAQAKIAIDRLREAIEAARAAGAPVPPGAEAELASLETRARAYTVEAGRVKQAQREVTEEMRAFEGAAGGAAGVLGSLNPQVGQFVAKFSEGGLALLVANQAGKEVSKVLHDIGLGLGLTKEQADTATEGIDALFSINPLEKFKAYLLALREGTAAWIDESAGIAPEYDKATKQLAIYLNVSENVASKLHLLHSEAIDGLIDEIAARRKLEESVTHEAELFDHVGKSRKTAADIAVAGSREILASSTATADELVGQAKLVQTLIGRYEEAGQKVPPALASIRTELELSAVQGLKNDKALQDGSVASQTRLAALVKELQALFAQSRDTSFAVLDASHSLTEFAKFAGLSAEKAREIADAVGVKTKDAMDRSTLSIGESILGLKSYASAIVGTGSATRAQSDLIAASLTSIDGQISKLPLASQKLFKQMVADLRPAAVEVEHMAGLGNQLGAVWGKSVPEALIKSGEAVHIVMHRGAEDTGKLSSGVENLRRIQEGAAVSSEHSAASLRTMSDAAAHGWKVIGDFGAAAKPAAEGVERLAVVTDKTGGSLRVVAVDAGRGWKEFVTLGTGADTAGRAVSGMAAAAGHGGRVLGDFGEHMRRVHSETEGASGPLGQFGLRLEQLAGEDAAKFGQQLPAALRVTGESLVQFSDILIKSGTLNAKQTDALIKSINDYRLAASRLSAEDQRGLADLTTKLEEVDNKLKETRELAVTSFGIETPASIRHSVDALGFLVSAFGDLGNVTGAQGERVRKEIEKIRAEIALLPADQRAAVQDMVDQLDKWSSALERSGDVARKMFGIQTPQAIRDSVAALQTLAASYGPLDSVSKEVAEKIAHESQRIRSEIALMAPAQRASVADQKAALDSLEATYGEWAKKAASASLDVVAALKTVTEAFRPLQDLLESTLKKAQQLRDTSLQKSEGDVAALQKRYDELKLKPQLSADESNELAGLPDQLQAAKQGFSDLTKNQDVFHKGQQLVKLGSAEVSTGLQKVSDFLHQNRDAYATLNPQQREYISQVLSGFSAAGDAGTATAADLTDVFRVVTSTLKDAGADTRSFDESLSKASGTAFNIKSSLADLNQPLQQTADGFGKVADQADRAATAQAGAADAASKSAGKAPGPEDAKKLGDAVKNATDAGVQGLKGLEAGAKLFGNELERALGLANQLKACLESSAFAAVGAGT